MVVFGKARHGMDRQKRYGAERPVLEWMVEVRQQRSGGERRGKSRYGAARDGSFSPFLGDIR